MNFCKDCKWHIRDQETKYWECMSPENIGLPNPIDGSQSKIVTFCESARKIEDLCGPDGNWFEPSC